MTTCASTASATGLPSDRRTLLSGAALASLVAATAAVPAIAEPAHPDRELLDLMPMLRQAASERSRCAEACDEAAARIEYPEYPEAVFWRKSDWPSVWTDKTRLGTIGPDDSPRFLYVTEGVPDGLRRTLARWEATPPIDRNFSDRSLSRVREIIAGAEDWTTRYELAEAASGLPAASKAFDDSDDILQDLLQRIAEIPARTAEGVVVKVFASLPASCRSADLIERNGLARLLAAPHRLPDDTAEMLLLSAQVAAAKITVNGLWGGAYA